MELKDWTHGYVKMRDAMRRTLLEHSMQGDVLTCEHKHGTHHYLISESLQVPSAKDRFTVVCLQSSENIDFLFEHWDEFLQPSLTVLFVNPGVNEYWQVNPLLHSRVADPETLRKGLDAMASEVPFV